MAGEDLKKLHEDMRIRRAMVDEITGRIRDGIPPTSSDELVSALVNEILSLKARIDKLERDLGHR